MLSELHVKNLALIEKADVEFRQGLNILTGETGAGKSIIIGSVGMGLGGKASRDSIRQGAPYAYVELVFSVDSPEKLKALAALEATLLDWRDGTAVPVSAMLSAPPEELRRRAEALAEALSPLHPCTAVETQGEVGGGARPGESLPAWAAALEPAEALEAHLRAWRVPILGRIHRGKLLLDVRTLLPGDEAEIAAALAAWREERA